MKGSKQLIPTDISFGIEMKPKMKRTTKYTIIPVATKVSMKVPTCPHHRFSILANRPVVVS